MSRRGASALDESNIPPPPLYAPLPISICATYLYTFEWERRGKVTWTARSSEQTGRKLNI